MYSVGVVALGPSGNNQGEVIDSCDFVVRMFQHASKGPINAGHKINALAGYYPNFELTQELVLNKVWDFWFAMPLYRRAHDCSQVAFIASAAKQERDIIFPSTRSVVAVEKALRQCSKRDCLSTGLITVIMALDMRPGELHIWGFDRCGNNDLPQNNYAGHKEGIVDSGAHDWAFEKKILAELEDRKAWLGSSCITRLVWHGRPKCV